MADALASSYQTGHFYLEETTNYLMVDGLYVIGAAASSSSLDTSSYIDTRDYPIACTPPTEHGQAFVCAPAYAPSRTQWVTGLTEVNSYKPYLFVPGSFDTSQYEAIEVLVI